MAEQHNHIQCILPGLMNMQADEGVLIASHHNLCAQAVAEKEEVEEYIRAGRELIGRQAGSVEEIGIAGKEAKQMTERQKDISQVIVPCYLRCTRTRMFVCVRACARAFVYVSCV